MQRNPIPSFGIGFAKFGIKQSSVMNTVGGHFDDAATALRRRYAFVEQVQFRSRRIVTRMLPRRFDVRLVGFMLPVDSGGVIELVSPDHARTENLRRVSSQRNDRRFDTDLGRTAIQYKLYRVTQAL